MAVQLLGSMDQVAFKKGCLVKIEDERGWLSCVKDFFVASGKEVQSRWGRRSNPLRGRIFPMPHFSGSQIVYEEQSWGRSRMLVVLIHGLNSSPLAWSSYLEERDDEVSYFVPQVYEKGYCELAEAVEPIAEVVRSYTQENPDNPVVLVGHSNGARIAAEIEQEVDAEKVLLISIAGPHCGSEMVNWMGRLGVTKLLGFSEKMNEELAYKGDWASQNLLKWQESEKEVKRVFFASADDWRIYPNQTSFPSMPNSSYHLICGESHVTIIDAVKDQVIASIEDWGRSPN